MTQSYGSAPYGQQPAYVQQQAYAQGVPAPAKSRAAAALFAFFLGGIGVHNFYRGQTERGVGHVVLAVITVVLMVFGMLSLGSAVDPYTGQLGQDEAAGLTMAIILAYLVSFANGIWTLVEFILILVSKDGSLQ